MIHNETFLDRLRRLWWWHVSMLPVRLRTALRSRPCPHCHGVGTLANDLRAEAQGARHRDCPYCEGAGRKRRCVVWRKKEGER